MFKKIIKKKIFIYITCLVLLFIFVIIGKFWSFINAHFASTDVYDFMDNLMSHYTYFFMIGSVYQAIVSLKTKGILRMVSIQQNHINPKFET